MKINQRNCFMGYLLAGILLLVTSLVNSPLVLAQNPIPGPIPQSTYSTNIGPQTGGLTQAQVSAKINSVYATDYGVVPNGLPIFDATTTSGNGIVTAPDGLFTSALIGQDAYTLNAGTVLSTGAGSVNGVCQVASVQSTTQLTMNCLNNASVIGTATLFVATNANTAANAAITALLAQPSCGTIVWPAGYIRITNNKYLSLPANCGVNNDNDKGVQWIAQGEKSTYFVIGPDFDWAGIGANAAFGANSNTIFTGGFNVTGLGMQIPAGGSGKILFQLNHGSLADHFAVSRFLSNNNTGIGVGGQENGCQWCFLDFSGTLSISSAMQNQTNGGYFGGGMNVAAAGNLYDYGSEFLALGTISVPNTVSGTFYGHSSFFLNGNAAASNALSIANAAGVADCTDCIVDDHTNAGSQGIAWTAAGKVVLRGDTHITGGATAGALYNVGVPTAKLYLEDLNTVFSPAAFPNWTGIVQGMPVHQGACTGVATASQTILLYGMGQWSATTCTVTSGTMGYVVQQVGATGQLSYLNVTATAAGTNASSGVVTVMKNGGATALTCTIGTGTSCIDNTHTAAYVLGDIITIQFTTQGADTLAGVKASVLTL